jgi:hypothetical protein
VADQLSTKLKELMRWLAVGVGNDAEPDTYLLLETQQETVLLGLNGGRQRPARRPDLDDLVELRLLRVRPNSQGQPLYDLTHLGRTHVSKPEEDEVRDDESARETRSEPEPRGAGKAGDARKVFVVHGRNTAQRLSAPDGHARAPG